MSKPKGFGVKKELVSNNKKTNPDIEIESILTEDETLKIIKMLAESHDKVTKNMIVKACSELGSMKLNGTIFELVMNGELNIRLNHRNKLTFGTKNQA